MAGADLPSFHGIIDRSAPMLALLRQIEKIAPVNVSVLIQGESWTGKELIARAVHRLSRRRERPLQIVNSGAFSRDLVLSELVSPHIVTRSPRRPAGLDPASTSRTASAASGSPGHKTVTALAQAVDSARSDRRATDTQSGTLPLDDSR